MQRRRLPVILCVLVWACAGLRAQSAAPDGSDLPLPENYFPVLKRMLEASLRQSPRMLARQADEAVAEGDRMIANAQRLPQAGGNFRYLPWDYDRRVGDPNSPYTSQKTTFSLNVVQPVYHWGALESAARIAELRQKLVLGETAETYRLLAAEIRGQFLQLIIKKAALARTRFAQRLADDDLANAKEKAARRVISEAEVFGPMISAEQARLATDRALEDFDASKRLLGKFVGAPPVTDAEIPDSIPDIAAPLGRFEAMLAEYSGDNGANAYLLRVVTKQIEIEKLNYRIATSRLRPNVDLLLGSSQDEQSYTANIGARYGVTSVYTGVQVNWSIFDGFASKGAKLNSLARRRELERRYKQIAGDLLDQAKAKFRQLQFSARSLEIGRLQFENSEKNYALAKDNATRGLSSETDGRMADYGRAGSLIDVYSARADYLGRIADFLGAVLKDPVLSNLPVTPP